MPARSSGSATAIPARRAALTHPGSDRHSLWPHLPESYGARYRPEVEGSTTITRLTVSAAVSQTALAFLGCAAVTCASLAYASFPGAAVVFVQLIFCFVSCA